MEIVWGDSKIWSARISGGCDREDIQWEYDKV